MSLEGTSTTVEGVSVVRHQKVSVLSDISTRLLAARLQVAEALLHMQVRLGMLKAEDIPSLTTPAPPPVIGGAIMLGKGAQLPKLVPPAVSIDGLFGI